MNKRQKEIVQAQLDSEKQTIKELKKVYEDALNDCELRIRQLSARTDLENIQTIVYQKHYQEAIKAQLEGVIEQLHSNEYASVSDYLSRCYQDGYVGVMYDIAGQGMPLILPMNQDQIVKAIQTDTKLSKTLYDSLGEDMKGLKKAVRSEISRGIANGASWNEVASMMSLSFQNTPFNRAYNRSITIARTEGHRIQCTAQLEAQMKAKENGCDVVKQWDATLDGNTRPHHRELDGKIVEVEDDFKYSGGTVSAPGQFGDPAEDCNCRCQLLQRAKWALGEAELDALKERAEYFGLDKTDDFEDFRKKYLKAQESERVRSSAQKISDHVYALSKYKVNGVTYNVDGKHVILDSKPHEKEVAEVIGSYLGKEVHIIPRIVYPQGISTPDYMIDGQKYDLKEPQGNGKNALFNMVHKKKSQASNFVFDISKCGLNIEEVEEQVLRLYTSKWTSFVNEVIILKDGKVINKYKK